MPVRELEELTDELKDLTRLLENERRPRARWIIFGRIQEILRRIETAEVAT